MVKPRPSNCNAPLSSPSVTITLSSNPFAVVPISDGCWVFSSLAGANVGIAVLKRESGRIEMVRVVPVRPAPANIALPHDRKLLIAATNDSAVVPDVARMTSGTHNAILGTSGGGGGMLFQSVYVNVGADGRRRPAGVTLHWPA